MQNLHDLSYGNKEEDFLIYDLNKYNQIPNFRWAGPFVAEEPGHYRYNIFTNPTIIWPRTIKNILIDNTNTKFTIVNIEDINGA